MTSPNDLTVLKGQRKVTRGQITKTLNNLAKELAPESTSAPSVEVTKISLDKLESLHNTVISLDNKIAALLDEEEIDQELTSAGEFTEHYLDKFLQFRNRYEALTRPAPLPPAVVSTASDSASNVSHPVEHNDRHQISLRLPKWEMSKFEGDPTGWREFWDSFEATIDQNESLTDIDKFKYLKSFLAKDAFGIADGYKLTAANYSTVVECLKERYGNPESAIFQHFEQLLALPIASNDLKSLQKVYDECERHVRSLVALGMPEDTFGKVFTPIILSKLPKFIRIDLHRQNGLVPWTLANLRTLLKTEIQVRQMSQHTFGNTTHDKPAQLQTQRKGFYKNSGSSTSGGHKGPGSGTSSSLVNLDGSKRKLNCVFCQEEHMHESCPKYPDAPSRRAKIKGKCFLCLRGEHLSKACRQRRNCKHCNSQWHHGALCPKKFPGPIDNSETTRTQQLNVHAKEFVPNAGAKINPTHMQTAVANIRFAGQNNLEKKGRIIFDTASSRTYATRSFCKKLGAVPSGESIVSIAAFQSKKRFTQIYPVVTLDIVCSDGTTQPIQALVTDHICEPAAIFPMDFETHPDLKGSTFAEPVVDCPVLGDIDLLVGGDFYYQFITGIRCFRDGLVLLTSKLGLVLAGTANYDSHGSIDSSLVCTMLRVGEVVDPKNLDLERFWKLDTIGVVDPPHLTDDDIAMSKFEHTVKFKHGRYEVQWPWKIENPDIPTNYFLALGRLKSLVRRVSSDTEIFHAYSSALAQQESLGIIEQVPLDLTEGKVHYLPHHHVMRNDVSTTKLRIVYDASARASKNSPSLNDCLYRGPVLLTDLCGLLLRFRLHPTAIVADLEKAFLQLCLPPDQRDFVRFLWLRNPNTPATRDNILSYRFCRVPFGVISSPFLLGATVKHHLENSTLASSAKLADDIYVDNLISGTGTVSEALNLYHESKRVFSEASMNLREWYTNDPAVQAQIPVHDQGIAKKPKVLGLKWNTLSDNLSCPPISVTASGPITKRKILQTVARLYDPLGFLSPVSLAGKCLLQELWRKNYDWDTPLPDEIVHPWTAVVESLSQAHQISIPRHISTQTGDRLELHCFCDASSKAYSAVVYLLSHHSDGSSHCHLIFSKTKVAPIKQLTIPRLELMGVFIGCKVLKFIGSHIRLNLDLQVVWTDSSCVLHWIKSAKSDQPVTKAEINGRFIRNRLNTILSSPGIRFQHVPSKDNPADLGSRGTSVATLLESSLWWHGPPWLCDPFSWPPSPCGDGNLISLPTQGDLADSPTNTTLKTTELCDITRFSSLLTLIRVTAWIKRFAKRNLDKNSPFLTVGELREAKRFWVRSVQQMEFNSIFQSLRGNPPKNPRTLINQLGLFLDQDNVIRCGGRLAHAHLPYSAKHPILLPKNHHFTDLVILDLHKTSQHVGVSQTLAELRYSYWVPQGRAQVKRILRSCVTCKKVSGGRFQVPPAPNLPESRITRQEPFATTGLDYIGPLFVKEDNQTRKVWIVLFTCAVIRAIHLEVVPDLSAYQFLLAFRRFVSLYGKPNMIISDNATQLHASHRALVKLVQQSQQIMDYSTSKGIEWKFLPEMSPWMGGFYERLVGTVKTSLKKVLGKLQVSLLELQTVVSEVSATVNQRPLTYVGEDVYDQPITPAHFLAKCGREDLPQPVTEVDQPYRPSNHPVSAELLLDKWKHTQKLLSAFWDIWSKEYLLSLRERQISKVSRQSSSIPTEGDVVLIKDNLPRGQWKLGRIVKLNESSDRKVRSAVVTIATGKNWVRPIKLLYPVELSGNEPNLNQLSDRYIQPMPSSSDSSQPQEMSPLPHKRPTRTAAAIAKLKLQDLHDVDSQ